MNALAELIIGCFAVMLLACTAFAAWPALKRFCMRLYDQFVGLDAFGKAVVTLAVCLSVMYGGSKSISVLAKTSSDSAIGVVAADYMEGPDGVPASLVSALGTTNLVAYSFAVTNTILTGSELASKVWFREDNRQAWTNFTNAGLQYESMYELASPTTIVWFAFATGSWTHAMIYVGDDLPPVYVETEGGVTLDAFLMTSTSATITYTVDAAALTGPGQVVFERMSTGGSWETVASETASAGQHTAVFAGFMVAKRTMWRIRLLVEVEE